MREEFVIGKSVEAATQAAYEKAEAMGFSRDEVSVTVEEFPERHLFKKSTPAKVKLSLPEEEKAAPKKQEAPRPAAPRAEKPEKPAGAESPAAPAPKAQPAAAEPARAAAPVAEEPILPLDLEADPRLKAARDYLMGVFQAMGVSDAVITGQQQGEASILRVEGENLGVLIGRRGETMEALSYLASLVANRQEGEYVKLGLDVAGYRAKREQDLQALARRIGAKVARSGRSYIMEPMNPYERRIIHSAIGQMEGLRSESKGEGADRRVVVYSTDPSARAPRNDRGDRRYPNSRGPRSGGRDRRPQGSRGPRPSSVPGREFADKPRSGDAAPIAPKPTQRFNDAELFDNYGKLDL